MSIRNYYYMCTYIYLLDILNILDIKYFTFFNLVPFCFEKLSAIHNKAEIMRKQFVHLFFL